MTFFEKMQKRERLYRHGGREVLRVSTVHVTGESAAAQHTESLICALAAYAEQTLLPRACQALDLAVTNGTGYAFRAHSYRVDVAERRVPHGVDVTLLATLAAGEEREVHTLVMCWTADGAWQKKERHHRVR